MFKTIDQIKLYFEKRQNLGIRPGLERMHKLLALQQHPEQCIKAVHIAGTNGKGSTLAYLKNALIANNYRVGVFTSPSMTGLTGHILINDQVIRDAEFIRLMNELYPSIKKLDLENESPTEFEIITVIAFIYFANSVDIALIETGMGGREDTTNCLKPIVSIITNVDRDHALFLGDTLEAIAKHKAGIIKNNVPVICGNLKEEVVPIITKEADKEQASIYKLGEQFTYTNVEQRRDEQFFIWSDMATYSFPINLAAVGIYQMENASIAIMALILLKEAGYKLKKNLTLEAIYRTTIPGRFELIQSNPTTIIDGAHNVAGIEAFLQSVTKKYQHKRKHLIFAGFKDKELLTMLTYCIPIFEEITLTTFAHGRAANAHDLAIKLKATNITVVDDWQEVIAKIGCTSAQPDLAYFITGSLHFIAIVRDYLYKMNQ